MKDSNISHKSTVLTWSKIQQNISDFWRQPVDVSVVRLKDNYNWSWYEIGDLFIKSHTWAKKVYVRAKQQEREATHE